MLYCHKIVFVLLGVIFEFSRPSFSQICEKNVLPFSADASAAGGHWACDGTIHTVHPDVDKIRKYCGRRISGQPTPKLTQGRVGINQLIN
jgi:hypothetical protein